MVQRKKPENVAGQQICVTKRTKQRILDLREGGDTHETVVARILDFYEKKKVGVSKHEQEAGTCKR